jgi:hypothetical protein
MAMEGGWGYFKARRHRIDCEEYTDTSLETYAVAIKNEKESLRQVLMHIGSVVLLPAIWPVAIAGLIIYGLYRATVNAIQTLRLKPKE